MRIIQENKYYAGAGPVGGPSFPLEKDKADNVENETEFVKVCTGCNSDVVQVGTDYLDYCPECEMIVEGLGYTKEIERVIE